ncbi:MAG: glutamate--tRNA ligase [Candidatus Portnoybacteria bacterium]
MPNNLSRGKQEIRVRFAPSPTGLFTIGNARTALFNYLFAKQSKGQFILRIEDTDKERSKEEYEKDIIENLKWLGLNWDEGPVRQSERTGLYKEQIKKLLEQGDAFYCDHAKEELEKEKKEQSQKKEAPRHICDSFGSLAPKREGIIRFRAPKGKIVFNDLVRGKVEIEGGLLGDFSIAKDEKTPLYNLSAVVDDAEMKISHIIRGEDHLPNTPKQILLYQALGFNIPQFAHLPLILGPDKSKMSKRHGSVSVGEYRKQGYLTEALINFMALLGWNPGTEKEIFSLDELVKEFSLERVHKGGAIFNLEKLNWINSQYIKKMDLDKLTKRCLEYLPKDTDFEYAKKVVALEQERLKKLSEIGEMTQFFFEDELDYDKNLLIWKEMSLKQVKENLELLVKELEKTGEFDQKTLERQLMPLTEKHGRGELLWPLRVALTGQKASPGPFEVMEVLGKEKSLGRIKQAINLIK